MRFFDTHAHLNDESFDTDRAALIEGLPSCGAELIMDLSLIHISEPTRRS